MRARPSAALANPLAPKPSPRASRPCLLALAVGAGLVLSAVQVLPSIEFAGRSDRTIGTIAERLSGHANPDSFAESVYDFSVGPWRLAEYVWPNVAGRQFPVNRRWLSALPAEGRTWSPSLYMGLLPLLLALGALRLRRAGLLDKSLSWAAMLSVAASFGWYGLGWLGHEIYLAVGGPAHAWPVGAPCGGLYWLMTLILPGYAYFRYPAKLLVVAALMLSVLSARGWDRLFDGRADRFRRGVLWLGGTSLCGCAVVLAGGPLWKRWLVAAEPDVLFGPLDANGAVADVLWALLQTAALCGAFWWLLRKGDITDFRGTKMSDVPVVRAIALLLVALDLAIANRWMVVCAPARLWEETPALAATVNARQQAFPHRVYRHPLWVRPAWKASASTTRLAEAVAWERDTLRPKYNLQAQIAVADVAGALMLGDCEAYLATTKENGRAWDAMGAEYVILPRDEVLPGGEQVAVDVADVSLWRVPRPLPRTWIVSEMVEGGGRKAEGGRRTDSSSPLAPRSSPLSPSCRVTHYDPLRVEIEATLRQPGLVVLADQFYPGWQLEVETKGQPPRTMPAVRTNGVMRGAALPAGEHRLVWRYRPASLLWGAALSGLGWMALAIGVAVCCLRKD